MSWWDSIIGIVVPVSVLSSVGALRKEAKKQRDKDANNEGADDLRAAYYEAAADGIEVFSSNTAQPKNLKKAGYAAIAVGERMIAEAERQEADFKS